LDVIDNITKTVKEDLKKELKAGSKISIAAACFSMYAFYELKDQLEKVDQFRFIFTSPTFVTDKLKKEKREFYIPRLNRERSIYGTEFEIKLRNELNQKAVARECADWITKKAVFKSNITNENMTGFMNVLGEETVHTYNPVNGFTTVDLGCERGNNSYNIVTKLDAPFCNKFLEVFDELWDDADKLDDVTEDVIESISAAYNENSPDFIYFVTLYNIFNEFLEDVSEDVLPDEAVGFKDSKIWQMLYNFQKDAALAIINKLEKYNGCILADSVGLGKTFTALAVIKYYQNRNRRVLVLCPKKLTNNWNTFKDNYKNNPLVDDRLDYDVLYHTDLNRNTGVSNGLDLYRLNWGAYGLVVIDESHNFRNGGRITLDEDRDENEKENRYLRLLNHVIKVGVPTKVLMLSATPVNNRFNDLKNQLALAYEGDSKLINDKLNISKPINDIFKNAQTAFNTWSKWDVEERTTENLLKMLDFDFFEVLDSVTIARSRKHIEKYYDTTDIGTFPTRLPPMSLRPPLTDLDNAINYSEIFEQLMLLEMSIYTPSKFILASKITKYADQYDDTIGLTQMGREQGIKRLMVINLMKRMESSVYSFTLTLKRIHEFIGNTIDSISAFEKTKKGTIEGIEQGFQNDFDDDDQNTDIFIIGKRVKIDIADMDYISWKKDLLKDYEILDLLISMSSDITPAHDTKLQTLISIIQKKLTKPINDNNKKIIVFTAFADTAEYVYKHISTYVKNSYALETAMVTGSIEGKTTIPKLKSDLNTVLTLFSPLSKGKDLLMPNVTDSIDILIATDCISEGQNLQDCDYLINYDIHWNPVRIIQRFGRIDRIGSKNSIIQLVNFWPDISLDEYINLKAKVETRMKIVNMTATGDDNVISDEEKTDLEYRKAQLKKLQEEVVDIEEMSSGISIMDLGLNEFRLDLLDYVKTHQSLDKTPFGMHAVTGATDDTPPGVLYVLKNRNNTVNSNKQNRLHPFYMVYVTNEGSILIDHVSPKKMLDSMRFLCKGKTEPILELCRSFNKETKDGKKMEGLSILLAKAIDSIITVKEENELQGFLTGGTVSFLTETIQGLNDFELICFLVVR
jgi:superfamily II DNA or RNA helicase